MLTFAGRFLNIFCRACAVSFRVILSLKSESPLGKHSHCIYCTILDSFVSFHSILKNIDFSLPKSASP